MLMLHTKNRKWRKDNNEPMYMKTEVGNSSGGQTLIMAYELQADIMAYLNEQRTVLTNSITDYDTQLNDLQATLAGITINMQELSMRQEIMVRNRKWTQGKLAEISSILSFVKSRRISREDSP